MTGVVLVLACKVIQHSMTKVFAVEWNGNNTSSVERDITGVDVICEEQR